MLIIDEYDVVVLDDDLLDEVDDDEHEHIMNHINDDIEH